MQPKFRVADWEVHPDLGTITRGQEQVHLEPRVMEVLLYLARNAGEVLPKERIIAAVWTDTFVTDEVLTNAISELRKAFGDNARHPTVIQTFPKRGYRLVAHVSSLSPPAEPVSSGRRQPDANATPRSIWGNPKTLAAAGALVAIVGFLLWQLTPKTPDGPIDSIAILPFNNDTGDTEADYLCSEIPARISASLSDLQELRVIPTSNLTRFEGQEVDPSLVASQLGVRAVLQGWVLQVGEVLSIRVELSDGLENRVLWGQKYHRPFSDVFQIEEEIFTKMARGLRLQLSPEEETRLVRHPTDDIEAYEDYLRGNFHLGQFTGRSAVNYVEALDKAIQFFERAIERDPEFALAYVGLSDAYWQMGFRSNVEEDFSKSRSLAGKAFDQNPALPAAHVQMGRVLASYDRNWSAAEAEFESARELGLDFSLSRDKAWVLFLYWLGHYDQALKTIEAQEKVSDPLSDRQTASTGYLYYWSHQFDQALEKGLKSNDPWLQILSYQALNQDDQALAALLALEKIKREQASQKEYREAFQKRGMKGVWRIWADKAVARDDQRYDIAAAYAFAEEKDLAFEWLRRTYEWPDLRPFFADARFDPLRDDPRFEQLLRGFNLPEDVIAQHLKTPR